jgi:DNA-binding NarL/FixJ family response regulator
MDRIKVFMIDDHKLFVEGVCSLLTYQKHIQVVGYALSGSEFLQNHSDSEIDVYLVDINMPEVSGVELTMKIKTMNPEVGILALTMYDDFRYIEDMIRSGVNGYILKSASMQELINAIEAIAAGKHYFSENIQEIIFSKIKVRPSGNEKNRTNYGEVNLTAREIEILSLIAKENTNQEIAEKLFISERTVETHRKNIFSKTKAKSIIGLNRYALKHGIIQPD